MRNGLTTSALQNQFCETCINRVGRTTEYKMDHLFFYTTFCQRFSTTGCKRAADQVCYLYQKRAQKLQIFSKTLGIVSVEAKSYMYNIQQQNELKYAAYFESLSRVHATVACKIGKED